MLLRKHLEGSVIERIEQPELERIITFDLRNRDELGDLSHKQLIVEIMGRHSNIILIDRQTNKIIDSIKHVSYAQSSYRAVLPGQPYKRPPAQDKLNPLHATAEDVVRQIDFNAGQIDRQLVDRFTGLSPLVAQEIIARAGMINRQSLPAAFREVLDPVKANEYEPEQRTAGAKEYFSVVPLTQVDDEPKTFTTVSQLLDRFFYGKAERDRVKQQAYDLERFLRNESQKKQKEDQKA